MQSAHQQIKRIKTTTTGKQLVAEATKIDGLQRLFNTGLFSVISAKSQAYQATHDLLTEKKK